MKTFKLFMALFTLMAAVTAYVPIAKMPVSDTWLKMLFAVATMLMASYWFNEYREL